jgi:hypothetical protein
MIDGDPVHVEKDDRCEQPGALVPVHERMVADDVEQIGRGHREQPVVDELATERRLGLREGRLQEAAIAEPRAAAVRLELRRVDPARARAWLAGNRYRALDVAPRRSRSSAPRPRTLDVATVTLERRRKTRLLHPAG